MWQKIYEDYQYQNFVVIAVAMDNDGDVARPWIEEAKPTYPVLIDRYHLLADLYNMVNVPQAVWIDEAGQIVRPAEIAGAYEGFRALDFKTMTMPEDVTATVKAARRLMLQRFAIGRKTALTALTFSRQTRREIIARHRMIGSPRLTFYFASASTFASPAKRTKGARCWRRPVICIQRLGQSGAKPRTSSTMDWPQGQIFGNA